MQVLPQWEEWAHAAFNTLVTDFEAGICRVELEGIMQNGGADQVLSLSLVRLCCSAFSTVPYVTFSVLDLGFRVLYRTVPYGTVRSVPVRYRTVSHGTIR